MPIKKWKVWLKGLRLQFDSPNSCLVSCLCFGFSAVTFDAKPILYLGIVTMRANNRNVNQTRYNKEVRIHYTPQNTVYNL